MGEDKILEDLGVTPGELRARLDIADWLLYSAQELALLLGLMPLLKPIRKARLRIKYGVKEELLPLVRLRGIGRARARKLYASNVKGLADLREIPLQRLSEIIGDKTAGQVKEQLGELEKETQSDNQLNLQDDVHENSKD
jgi:helicase